MKRKTLFSLLWVWGLTLALGVLLIEISATVNAQGAKSPGEMGVQVALDPAFNYRNLLTTTNGLLTSSSISVYACPLTSTNQYSAGIAYQFDVDDPVRPAYNHADKNLELRGYTANTDPGLERELVDYGSNDPIQPPQLATLFDPYRVPALSSFYRVHNWNWAPSPDPGTRADPITTWPVTALGMETTPSETLRVPTSGYDIGGGVEVIVLFADEDTVALRYTRDDSSAPSGYTIHIDNICTDPNLLALYNSLDDPDGARYTYVPPGGRPYGYDLPAMAAGQPFGTARDTEMVVAIVDTGAFMDTRSRNDWWQIRPGPPPSEPPDTYEPDDTCDKASTLLTNGTIQAHTFHTSGDEDWAAFDAISGTTYIVEALTSADSDADVTLEVYDTCGGSPGDGQDNDFSPDVRLCFTAPQDGPLYLRLRNHDPSVAGPDVSYHLSVRALETTATPGAVVLVAGKLRDGDPLQGNIHHVTDEVYRLFLDHGYNGDRIYYLATDATLDPDEDGMPDVDATSSNANLEYAITGWAASQVEQDGAFTLYMMDHGGYDDFYLNGSPERVSPDEIESWLDTLEDAAEGIHVNVVVDACKSGSFIDLVETISGPGRAVIASTGARRLAYATPQGSLFSDHFVAALRRDLSLYSSFEEAKWAVEAASPRRMGSNEPEQTPWLDDDGDGLPNEVEDGEAAAVRGFAYAGTFGDGDEWPPYVVSVKVGEIVDGRGVITAEVRDNENVAKVWAEIYPPSYVPPEPAKQEELVLETMPTVTLSYAGDSTYCAEYTGFSTPFLGGDRVVVYAVDEGGLVARPRSVGGRHRVDLPLIVRTH